jgi:hypothetical protein
VVVTATSTASDLEFWWQAGSTVWHQETVATSTFDSRPSIAWTGRSLVIAAASKTGSVDYWWQRADAQPWNHEIVATPF